MARPKRKTEDLQAFNARRLKVTGNLPARGYVALVNHLLPGKYSANQLRDFKNGKTLNAGLLEDLEKIYFKK